MSLLWIICSRENFMGNSTLDDIHVALRINKHWSQHSGLANTDSCSRFFIYMHFHFHFKFWH